MPKIGKYLPIGVAAVVTAVTTAVPAGAQVSGRLHVSDAGGRTAPDLGDAVIFLEGRGPRAPSHQVTVALDARQFRPRVVVAPLGSMVRFPNQDPFNHNVFSLSEGNSFDLGLYGRGETRGQRFRRPGLVRLYCNIHPRMTAFVVVRDNAWYTQPGADGSFTIPSVPPGSYTLTVWHERAPEITRGITVPPGGLSGLELQMDASGYRYVQHTNKYGQAYGATRERY
jgi:plastocyanin